MSGKYIKYVFDKNALDNKILYCADCGYLQSGRIHGPCEYCKRFGTLVFVSVFSAEEYTRKLTDAQRDFISSSIYRDFIFDKLHFHRRLL